MSEMLKYETSEEALVAITLAFYINHDDDGKLYAFPEECIDAVLSLMDRNYRGPFRDTLLRKLLLAKDRKRNGK